MKFQHSVDRGTVARGAEAWPIEDGIVDLPEDLGRALGLPVAVDPPLSERRVAPAPPQNSRLKKGVG